MDTYLEHHGIKGMKWGIRRYQNADGTLTNAGKLHYSSNSKPQIKKERRTAVKNRRSMSTIELKNGIERLKLERQYKDLSDADISPGKMFVEQVMSDAGKRVLTTALTGAALYAGKAIITGEFNAKELGSAVFNGGPKKK